MSTHLASLTSAIESLQQAFESHEPGGKISADGIGRKAEAKGFPDRDLAVQVWRHLEQQQASALRNVVERRVSEEQISKALFFALLDVESSPARRSARSQELSASFRSILRELATRLGIALENIGEVVAHTGMGYTPLLSDLAEEFTTLLAKFRSQSEVEHA